MEVNRWTKSSNREGRAGEMVRVSREEAVLIVQTLIAQIQHNNCNTDRREFFTDKGEYFSISVAPVLPEESIEARCPACFYPHRLQCLHGVPAKNRVLKFCTECGCKLKLMVSEDEEGSIFFFESAKRSKKV